MESITHEAYLKANIRFNELVTLLPMKWKVAILLQWSFWK
jgi:hypothetical protein